MATLRQDIIDLLETRAGLTDREITNALRGSAAPQQPVNQQARALAEQGLLRRQRRADGLIGNFLATADIPPPNRGDKAATSSAGDGLSEDEVKERVQRWLESQGWKVTVAWGHSPGVDMDARRDTQRWLIEAKGIGSRQPMRVNYFLGALGETLQRMDDAQALYSIALPDVAQFRGLWQRLPTLAKVRNQLSALFVSADGTVEHDRITRLD